MEKKLLRTDEVLLKASHNLKLLPKSPRIAVVKVLDYERTMPSLSPPLRNKPSPTSSVSSTSPANCSEPSSASSALAAATSAFLASLTSTPRRRRRRSQAQHAQVRMRDWQLALADPDPDSCRPVWQRQRLKDDVRGDVQQP
ncbi:uncharacterized protein LOC135943974 [Cloeon dipterum]|uniref:uncharacterized protein LOC135943974 n=1 Tax=Cloeon dipterum TaxID=197152 RepID=UPI0032207388